MNLVRKSGGVTPTTVLGRKIAGCPPQKVSNLGHGSHGFKELKKKVKYISIEDSSMAEVDAKLFGFSLFLRREGHIEAEIFCPFDD